MPLKIFLGVCFLHVYCREVDWQAMASEPLHGAGAGTHLGTGIKLSFLFSALSVPTTLTGVEAEATQPAGPVGPGPGGRVVWGQPVGQPHLHLLLHR